MRLVKEVTINGSRYIVCRNERQARKDEADRNTIVASLSEKIAKAPSSLISNKGYRSFLTITKESVTLDAEKIKTDARFDGIWVLTTNTKLPAKEVALKYKELWMVEHIWQSGQNAKASAVRFSRLLALLCRRRSESLDHSDKSGCQRSIHGAKTETAPCNRLILRSYPKTTVEDEYYR